MPRKNFERTKQIGFSTIDKTGKIIPGKSIPVVCERIRFYREKCGMEQKDLASAIGISGNAICNWENGRSRPDISLVPAICRTLGITLNQLFDIKETVLSQDEASFLDMCHSLTADNRQVLRTLADCLARMER